MNRARMTLVLALAAVSISSPAQQAPERGGASASVAVRAAAVAPANDIPVLRSGDTVPPQVAEAAINTRTRAPTPLAANRYQQLTGRARPAAQQSDNKSLAAPDTTLQYLKLTPRDPYTPTGHLEFNEVRHINAAEDAAIFYGATDPSMAFTRAHVKVQAGQRYLVDVSVATSRDVTFHLGAGGNSVENGVTAGNHHLLIYLEPHATKEVSIMLFPDVADYVFHGIEITRID